MYGGEDRKIILEGENHLVGVVIDRFGTDVMIHPHKESLFYATVTVTVSPQFFGWLMHEPDMVDPVWGVDEDDV